MIINNQKVQNVQQSESLLQLLTISYQIIQYILKISFSMLQKIQDFTVIERLDETHGGETQILLGKYKNNLLVCKSIQKRSLTDSIAIEHVINQKEALKYFTAKNVKGVNRMVNTFQDRDKLYIVLEPVEGLPLHKLMKMAGQINGELVFIIVSQIGLILQEFHENGYIYRDIKASNFMINRKGKVTLIDMGHAKKIDHERTYTICGTIHSMPPQIYHKNGYSYEFDYYGFGIIFYELLTGKAPFGYSNTNPNILEDMKKGISQQQLNIIECTQARDLVSQLLSQPSTRIGLKKGFQQILEHEYFNAPQFLDAKDIYDGVSELDSKDPKFQFFISQIIDFGLEQAKFDEILPQDPFYKFFA